MSESTTPDAGDAVAESAAAAASPDTATDSAPTTKKRRLWPWLVLVAVIAVLIAGPGSVALYVARQHSNEQAQLALGAWWAPVSAQLEQCTTAVTTIKQAVAEGTGEEVVAAGNDLQQCIDKVGKTPAPDDTVNLALSGALDSLRAVAGQTIRLGTLMGKNTYAQGDPDQFAAYLALQKQFLVAQVTLVSLENVVRQAAGQTTTPLPTGAP